MPGAAVPPIRRFTVSAAVVLPVRVRVKTPAPALDSSTVGVVAATLTVLVSSSVIVRVWVAFALRFAAVALLRVMMTVSADSIAASLRIVFGSSFAVSPAAKVSVPLASV